MLADEELPARPEHLATFTEVPDFSEAGVITWCRRGRVTEAKSRETSQTQPKVKAFLRG